MSCSSLSLSQVTRYFSDLIIFLILVAAAYGSDAQKLDEEYFGGIGVQIEVKNGYTVVVDLIPDGAAVLSGALSVSDTIVGIGEANGQIVDIQGWPLSDVVTLLRGQVGSEVALEVIPWGQGSDTIKQITITRGKVSIPETLVSRNLESLINKAEEGDAQSQYQLAIMYNNGDGAPVSSDLYAYWARAAADNGHAGAQFEVAMIIFNSSDPNSDRQDYLLWLKKAADQGFAAAENNLGLAYRSGKGVQQDNERAVFWYEKSAAQGDLFGITNLGEMYAYGIGVVQDKATAFDLYQKAGKQDHPRALALLGLAYQYGEGIERSIVKALENYRKGALLGNDLAQAALGNAYSWGNGVTQDHKEAFRWYMRSAEQGNDVGQNGVGSALYFGNGVERDESKGIVWLLKAASQGNMTSQSHLGYAFFNGYGVDKNEASSLKWNSLAAEQGDHLSQERLGQLYYYGIGVPENKSTAHKWFLRAASQGNHNAEFAVGQAYSFGEGVAKDPEAAVFWYARAAEGGNAVAQFNLAVAYANGDGVGLSDDRALEWYLAAAQQGYAEAQFNAALRYQSGTGVEVDLEKAFEWHTKASNSGHVNAKHQLALLYEWGEGTSRDEEKVIELLADAAIGGNAGAALNLGLATSYGDRKDTLTSLEYLKRAYKQGEVSAGYYIALQYLDKNSGFYFPKAAYDILLQLEKSGGSESVISTSLALLGYMHANGLYVEKNISKALEYFERLELQIVDPPAIEVLIPTWNKVLTPQLMEKYKPHLLAHLDHYCESVLTRFSDSDFQANTIWPILRSQKLVEEDFVDRCFDRHIASLVALKDFEMAGMRYQNGIPGIVPENPSKAYEYIRKSVESEPSASNAAAMELLATYYQTGYGTNKNDEQVLNWRKKSADLGFPLALNNLGYSYEKGLFGLEANDEIALDYYKSAYEADPNCSVCITNLARAYEGGVEDSDPAMAKILYSKAFELGNLEAGVLLAKLESGGLAGPKNPTAAISILEEVIQGNDSYKIEVFEADYNDTIEEARDRLTLLNGKVKSKQAIDLGNYHALVIGNADYDSLTDLSTAGRDASDVARVLEQEYGFEVELLLNATRDQTLSAINRFKRDLNENDNFLLYYAGHGVIDDSQEGFWLPTDADENDDVNWIPNVRINRTLKKFTANNIILVADSCYAGSQFRALVPVELDQKKHKKVAESGDSLILRLSTSRSRVAITSGGLEPVADRIGFSENSVFASSFISVLKNNSSTIPSGDLFKLVRQRVIPITVGEGLEQTPEFGQLWASGHEGGDFVFSRVR